MANTSYLRTVVEPFLLQWTSEQIGVPLKPETVVVGQDSSGRPVSFAFDGVSPDGTAGVCISASSSYKVGQMRKYFMEANVRRLTEQMESDGDQPDLTPMIDCVFLLLLFFVVTAVFAEESNLFKVELPKAARAEVRQPKDVVVVMISRDGQYSVKDSLVPEEELWARLNEIHRQSPIKTVIIKGDRRSPYEKAITAMDVAHSLNVREVTMAVAKN